MTNETAKLVDSHFSTLNGNLSESTNKIQETSQLFLAKIQELKTDITRELTRQIDTHFSWVDKNILESLRSIKEENQELYHDLKSRLFSLTVLIFIFFISFGLLFLYITMK